MVTAGGQPFPWPLFAVVAIVAGVVGYGVGSFQSRAQRPAEMMHWNGSHAQAEDAMRRWAPKGIGGE